VSGVIGRVLRAEWTKLRSVPGTSWMLLATVIGTIGFSLFVCSVVDTGGGAPTCLPGASGCGDEEVVLNSLAGAYLGQIAVVALGVLAATADYETGTIRATFAAMPRRSAVVMAKLATVAGPVLAVGFAAATASFLLGQKILHGNGFVPSQGYPTVSLADASAARAVIGTALYLGGVAVLAFAVGIIARRSGPAIAVVLTLLYAPTIVSLMLAEPLRGWVQKVSPMSAGLAIQRTVLRADSVPIGGWAGLGVAAAWSTIALAAAFWLVRRRDA
jgi:ABC-2 type transport system permease protein